MYHHLRPKRPASRVGPNLRQHYWTCEHRWISPSILLSEDIGVLKHERQRAVGGILKERWKMDTDTRITNHVGKKADFLILVPFEFKLIKLLVGSTYRHNAITWGHSSNVQNLTRCTFLCRDSDLGSQPIVWIKTNYGGIPHKRFRRGKQLTQSLGLSAESAEARNRATSQKGCNLP